MPNKGAALLCSQCGMGLYWINVVAQGEITIKCVNCRRMLAYTVTEIRDVKQEE